MEYDTAAFIVTLILIFVAILSWGVTGLFSNTNGNTGGFTGNTGGFTGNTGGFTGNTGGFTGNTGGFTGNTGDFAGTTGCFIGNTDGLIYNTDSLAGSHECSNCSEPKIVNLYGPTKIYLMNKNNIDDNYISDSE